MKSYSDFEQISSMLEKKGIGYEVKNHKDGSHELIVEKGYSGFMTVFWFDADGTFVDIGAYE